MKERMAIETLKKYLTTWQHCDPNGNVTAWLEELVELRERLGITKAPAPVVAMVEGKEHHAYLSAGDVAGASGDRPYTGCYLCGRPRSAHDG